MPAKPANLKVINLFGPPGSGKTAVRSGLFWLMRSHRLAAEEVSEYAKYLILAGRRWQLTDEQVYLFAKQHHRQLILQGKYEYAITDSPLQLCDFYAPPGYFQTFPAFVDEVWSGFENINFYLTRDQLEADFETEGRAHDFRQSAAVDETLREFLAKKNIPYTDLKIDMSTPWRILDTLRPGLAKLPDFT